MAVPLVFLEGDPAYYSTRGFERADLHGFRSPSLRIPAPAFQVALLSAYEPWMTGTLVYSEVFWAARLRRSSRRPRLRGRHADPSDDVSRWVREWQASRRVPGVALVVTDRTTTLRVEISGLADRAGMRPVDAAQRWQIGSISKAFSSIVVLQLAREGLLSVDDRVVDLLPWAHAPRPRHHPAPLDVTHRGAPWRK